MDNFIETHGEITTLCIKDKNNITRIRVKILLTDTQGNIWYCEKNKDYFEMMKDDYVVTVYSIEGLCKKFIKKYLNFGKKM